MQSGPISSGVTKNTGDPCTYVWVQPSLPIAKGRWPHSNPSFRLLLIMTLSFAPFSHLPPYPSAVNGVSCLTYFNIWRGGPPGRRTNRSTWQVPGGPVGPWVQPQAYHRLCSGRFAKQEQWERWRAKRKLTQRNEHSNCTPAHFW